MEFILVEPPLPSLARYARLYAADAKLSCLRALEYEKLATTMIAGRVLDVGGGEKAVYRKRLPKDIQYESVNIDPDMEPTHVIEPERPFPISDENYDFCLCLNTLEHVYDARFVLREIRRVLKPGGIVHITVPFIFRIHAHPDDYFRATPSWWRESLEREHFPYAEIQPLIWGRRATANAITGSSTLLGSLGKPIAHLADLLYARLAFPRSVKTYSGGRGERICNVALGYFISARK